MLRQEIEIPFSTSILMKLFAQPTLNVELPPLDLTKKSAATSNTLFSTIANSIGWLNPFKSNIDTGMTAKVATVSGVLMSLLPKVSADCFTVHPAIGSLIPCDFYQLECEIPGLANQTYQQLIERCNVYQSNPFFGTLLGQICPHEISLQQTWYFEAFCDPKLKVNAQNFGQSHYGYPICNLYYMNGRKDACTFDLVAELTSKEYYTQSDKIHELVLIGGITAGVVVGVGLLAGVGVCFFKRRAQNADKAATEILAAPTEATALVPVSSSINR